MPQEKAQESVPIQHGMAKHGASKFDLDVFNCHNQARMDPKSLIPLL